MMTARTTLFLISLMGLVGLSSSAKPNERKASDEWWWQVSCMEWPAVPPPNDVAVMFRPFPASAHTVEDSRTITFTRRNISINRHGDYVVDWESLVHVSVAPVFGSTSALYLRFLSKGDKAEDEFGVIELYCWRAVEDQIRAHHIQVLGSPPITNGGGPLN